MRLVNWKDKRGHEFRRIVPDYAGDEQSAFGVPSGPPELDQLDWESMKKEINNALVAHGIYTWDDVQKNPNGVGVALSIFKRYIIALYREDWMKPKPTNEQ